MAHAALADRSDALSAFERRVLIICNGERSLEDVHGLLGPPAPAAVRRLLSEGYLASAAEQRGLLRAALSTLRGTRGTGTGRELRDPTDSGIPTPRNRATAQEAIASDARPPPEASGGPSARRRSVVAAKMYVIGLLQLQRNPEAAAQAAMLQTCREPEAIMAAIADALECIADSCNASYTRRVIERLEEITPGPLLPLLTRPRSATVDVEG